MTDICRETRSLLEGYVDGTLEPAPTARLRVHLKECAGCAAEHDLAASLPSRLRALAAPPPPESLLAAVMEAVQRERRARRLAPGLVALEAALVALAVWYLSGLSGLAGLGGRLAADAGQLVGWGAGSSTAPAPATGDVFLVLLSVALALVCAVHLGLLSQAPGPRRRA